MSTTGVFSATTLIGNSVKNSQGEDLGNLKEIMFDAGSSKIAYGVVDFGGFLGMGNKLFAVPWSALDIDTDNHAMTFDIAKDKLENAEGFDQDNWPDFANREWAQKTYSYYGQEPYWND